MKKSEARITGENIGRALASEAIAMGWMDVDFPLHRASELSETGRWHAVAEAAARTAWLRRLAEHDGDVEADKHEIMGHYR